MVNILSSFILVNIIDFSNSLFKNTPNFGFGVIIVGNGIERSLMNSFLRKNKRND